MRARIAARYHVLALTGIVACGFGLRAWGLTWGLTNATVSSRAHPDEWTVYWLFRWFDGSHSLNPCPDSTTSCFFDWGTVFPYLAYPIHWLVSLSFSLLPNNAFGAHADPYFVQAVLAGRIVSMILSTATIVLAYRLGSLLYGRNEGLFAALIVSLSTLLIQLAHFATPDSTTLFLMALAVLRIAMAYRSPSRRNFVLAGLTLGAAGGSEFHMVLLAVPLFAAWVLASQRRATWLLSAATVAAATFLVCNPYIVIDLPSFLSAFDHSMRMRTVDSQEQYGGRFSSFGPAWLYVVRYALGYGVGYALTVWLVVGATVACLKRHSEDILLLSWIAPYFVLVTLAPAKFMRYSAPLIVPLAVLGGRAAIEVLRTNPLARRRIISVILLAAALYSGTYDAAYAGLFSSPDPRLAAARWIDTHAPAQAEVGYEALPDGLLNLPYFVSDGGYRSCFAIPNRAPLVGVQFVALDDYVFDEATPFVSVQVRRLRSRIATGSAYSLVDVERYTPTFLGLSFPIASSPHDWRYPTHDISVYELRAAPSKTSVACFEDPASASTSTVHNVALGH